MRVKITKTNIMMLLLSIMPLIDSINGYMVREGGGGANIGQIYRIVILILLMLHIPEMSREDILLYWGSFTLFIPIQFAVDAGYGISSVLTTLKLFMPLLITVSIFSMLNSGRIGREEVGRVVDTVTILTPLTIVVPYLLGVGYKTYEYYGGHIGFYYAVNEISFVISCCIIISIHKLLITIELKSILILAMNIMAILLVGSKSGLVTAGIFTLLFILYDGRSLRQFRAQKVVAVVIIIMASIFGIITFMDNLMDVTRRFRFLDRENSSQTMISGFTSGRSDRIVESWGLFSNSSVFRMLFGWGLGGVNNGRINVEMDFIDLLYAVGFLGTVIVALLYFRLIRTIKWDFWKTVSFIWGVILIALGGHVLYAGLGGMMLSLLLIYFYNSEMTGKLNSLSVTIMASAQNGS